MTGEQYDTKVITDLKARIATERNPSNKEFLRRMLETKLNEFPVTEPEIVFTRSRLTRAERTKAINRFARRYGYYARTVRNMTSLRYRAVYEYATEVLQIGWPVPPKES